MVRFRLAALVALSLTLVADPAIHRYGLGNSFQKLRRDHRLTIGYFGGSITYGQGASDLDRTSWRALTTAWFRDHFPGAAITEVNASLSGTGSDLGAFRCSHDLLAHHPDLVFVEFAVNDIMTPRTRVERSVEGIVRQIWRADPRTDIVFVYTTTPGMAESYQHARIPDSIIWHEKIAEHYGIPSVNVGEELSRRVLAASATWKELLPDEVHPSDTGHHIYADQVRRTLESQRNAPERGPIAMPVPLSSSPLETAHLEATNRAVGAGWVDTSGVVQEFPSVLSAKAPGERLSLRFTGSTVGLFWVVAPDSGDIEWSIDGGPPQRCSSWDELALQCTRVNYAILADALPRGAHVLNVQIAAGKHKLSQGHAVRIGAFLVD